VQNLKRAQYMNKLNAQVGELQDMVSDLRKMAASCDETVSGRGTAYREWPHVPALGLSIASQASVFANKTSSKGLGEQLLPQSKQRDQSLVLHGESLAALGIL